VLCQPTLTRPLPTHNVCLRWRSIDHSPGRSETVTPRSSEDWIERYEGLGYRVLAPACPGFEVKVEALNADPLPIEAVTVPQIIEHLESHVRDLDSPPILMGDSTSGVFTQILLDRGYGAVGVAINSAPTRVSRWCRSRRSSRRSRCSRTRPTPQGGRLTPEQ
jgi:hypothetical protein